MIFSFDILWLVTVVLVAFVVLAYRTQSDQQEALARLQQAVAHLGREQANLVERLRRHEERAGATDAGSSTDEPAPQQKPVIVEPTIVEQPKRQETPQSPERPATSTPSVPAATQASGGRSVEELVGSRWSVWLGAVALGLGAMFLVKHSIDQGYLTPAVRILFGVLLAAGLMGGGEVLRRRDIRANIAGLPDAYVPGALTASGIIAAFATIYAAYALYHFLDPLVAFLLLAAVSVAALVYSMVHGPALAVTGLVGSYVTPALVATDEPSAWSLFVYLLFVTVASYVAAQARSWLWLAVAALVGSVGWGLLWFVTAWQPNDVVATGFYVLALMVFTFLLLKQAELTAPKAALEETDSSVQIADWPAVLGLGAIGLLAAVQMRLADYQFDAWTVFILASTLLLLGAWMWRSLTFLAVFGAALFLFAYGTWHFGFLIDRGPTIDFVTPPALTEFLSFGFLFAAAYAGVGYLAVRFHRNGDPVWAVVSAATPLLAFAYAYLRATHFEHSLPFGFAALALAGLATLAADILDRHSRARRYVVSAGIYATVAVAALALAFTILLEKGWLTVAIAALAPALAYIARQRDMRVLVWLAAALAGIVAVRFVYDPRIVGEDLGTTPIFNWLLYGYGIPAFAFAVGASMFRKQRDDLPVAILEGVSILFFAALIFFEIRHYMNDGDVFRARFDLAEASLHSMVWLSLSLAYQRVSERSQRWMPDRVAALFGALGLLSVLVWHLLVFNPLITNDSIGEGIVFNELLLAYALPAALCALLFWRASGNRPVYYVRLLAFAAFILAFAWVSLEVRALFQGSQLGIWHSTSDAEWYSYSAAWLGYGLALLGAGIALTSRQLRQAGLVLVGLTVAKVFLSDMSDLTGALRALSFIGLGLTLVGIGALYQRLIFPSPTGPAQGTPAGEGEA